MDPISQNVLPNNSVLILSRNSSRSRRNLNNDNDEEDISEVNSVDLKMKRLNDKVDRVTNKTNGMLARSYELEFNSEQLRRQLDNMRFT